MTRVKKTSNECTFPECGRAWHSKGLCAGHYQQQYQGQELRPLIDHVSKFAPAEERRMVHVAKRSARNAKRRALEASGTVTGQEVKELIERQEGRCVVCNDPWKHLDHIMPLCRGGKHLIENLQLLCSHCNTTKYDKTMEEFMEYLERYPEKDKRNKPVNPFNPYEDRPGYIKSDAAPTAGDQFIVDEDNSDKHGNPDAEAK